MVQILRLGVGQHGRYNPTMPNLPTHITPAFAAYPNSLRPQLLALRDLIHHTAAGLNLPITESLKWGQPSFAAPQGTPIRLGVSKSGHPALFVHCQTTVIRDFAALHPEFTYDGNRAIHLDGAVPEGPLRMLITAALTYHAH